jgi:hypothetical protein
MNKITLRWDAPGLDTAVAAISGSIYSGSEVQKVVLPANQPLTVPLTGRIKPGDSVVFRGQLPSGEVVQKTIVPTGEPNPGEIVITSAQTSDDSAFSFESYLGAFKKSHPDLQRQMLDFNSSIFQSLMPDEITRRAKNSSRVAAFVSSLTDQAAWGNLWLRLWCYERESVFPWQSYPLPLVRASFRSGAVVCQLEQLPLARPCFLELGRPGGVSRFAAVPPVASTQIIIRASWNPKLFEVTGGRTLSIISSDREDARLQIALKYIQENALSEAETLINDMYSSMIEKASNPFGATVGGYFLLKFGESSRIANMAQNFHLQTPWLPDSALIYAWKLMEEDISDPECDQHMQQIKTILLEAVSRGVPLFTVGLRFLFERLRQIKADAQAGQASQSGFSTEVQNLADLLGACDEKQYLTTFFGMTPWHATRQFDPSFTVPTENRQLLSDLNLNWAFDSAQTSLQAVLSPPNQPGQAPAGAA